MAAAELFPLTPHIHDIISNLLPSGVLAAYRTSGVHRPHSEKMLEASKENQTSRNHFVLLLMPTCANMKDETTTRKNLLRQSPTREETARLIGVRFEYVTEQLDGAMKTTPTLPRIVPR